MPIKGKAGPPLPRVRVLPGMVVNYHSPREGPHNLHERKEPSDFREQNSDVYVRKINSADILFSHRYFGFCLGQAEASVTQSSFNGGEPGSGQETPTVPALWHGLGNYSWPFRPNPSLRS